MTRTLKPEMDNRTACYALLAELYRREPSAEWIETLKRTLTPVETGETELDAALARFVCALSSAPARELVEPLAVDYARVFLGAGRIKADAAYPIESVYTSPGRLVMQEAWEAVLAAYAEAGFERRPDEDLHEDHLALELDFLARLGRRAAKADAEGDAEARNRALQTSADFLKVHPLRWTDAFARDVERYAETDFYKALAAFTVAFLKADARFLQTASRT